MRALLAADVTVERFAAFAELAWLERRPELGLLCRAALDAGRRLAADTVAAVLPGLSDAGARNVIRWCEALGLCDAHGGLTALGDDVAQTDEAPVPEQGVYDFWLARHPLIGHRLLAVERLASRTDGRFELLEPLSGGAPDRGVPFRSGLDPRQRFVLRDLPTRHGPVVVLRRETEATCRILWTLDLETGREHWQITGRIESPHGLVPIQHEPEPGGVDGWALVEHWGMGPPAAFGRWDPKARRLAVAFEGLEAEELERFTRTLTLGPVEVPGKGCFDRVTLEDVPIGPATATDAQRWAMARLWRSLEHEPRYRSRRDVRTLFVERCEGTPLEPHGPTLPPHVELIGGDRIARQPAVFWSLTAPVDLAPQPPTAEQLGALRIGGHR